MILGLTLLIFVALGGGIYAFSGGNDARAVRRTAAIARPRRDAGAIADGAGQRKRNIQTILKDAEKKSAAARKNKRPSLRKRLDQAGLPGVTPQRYYIACGGLFVLGFLFLMLSGQGFVGAASSAMTLGFGVPRWSLGFLRKRREKKFTAEFANAIDVIVRSVRSGLPTNEALRIVARESPDPVGGEFHRLTEGLKVGVTLDQGLAKMYESMPTTEVSFFGIVMSIQQKSGGNLSEALSNLSAVLRDRKRLQGKIKAMSSEAKASAWIIGSLPPGVMLIVYLTAPNYISVLFTEKAGNLMLMGCGLWMGAGIFIMRQMINFKH